MSVIGSQRRMFLLILALLSFFISKAQDSLILKDEASNLSKTIIASLVFDPASYNKVTTELYTVLMTCEDAEIKDICILSMDSSTLKVKLSEKLKKRLVGYKFNQSSPKTIFFQLILTNPFSSNRTNHVLQLYNSILQFEKNIFSETSWHLKTIFFARGIESWNKDGFKTEVN